MSRKEQDKDYKPKAMLVRSSRRRRKVEQVTYSEAEIECNTESEPVLGDNMVEGDRTFTSVNRN